METSWKSPKIIIGKEATGNFYFVRENLENDIWKEIEKGNNILITAPRRVGKTSVMKSLAEKSIIGYKLIFKNVQGIAEEAKFYKTLYELILTCLDKSKRYKKQFENYFKKMGISEISTSGIKLDRHDINYLEEINQLIPQLDAKGENIILLIDELPEVLHNLRKKDKNEDAHTILKNLRHWRQEKGFEKIQFILAGSIGIHYVINLIGGRPADINDLNHLIHCPPLDDERGEFEKYMDWVTKEATMQYNSDLRDYLKVKIGYLVPFFINLLVDEIDRNCRKDKQCEITTNDIDNAVAKVISNRAHFSDWKKRLQDYMSKKDFSFVNEILIHAAHKDEISIQEIYDIASKHEKTDCYMDFIADLEQDGYITKQNEKYVFVSPFLKTFWKNDNPIYNG